MSWSRASCSTIDIWTFLIEMISLTMSRISSAADSVSSCASCDRSIVSISALKIVVFVWKYSSVRPPISIGWAFATALTRGGAALAAGFFACAAGAAAGAGFGPAGFGFAATLGAGECSASAVLRPNLVISLLLQQSGDIETALLGDRLGLAKNERCQFAQALRRLGLGADFDDRRCVGRRGVEQLRLPIENNGWLQADMLGVLRRLHRRDFRVELVDDQQRRRVIRARAGNDVDEVLGVAERRKIRRRCNDDLIGGLQQPLRPAGPDMRDVDDDRRRRAAHHIDYRLERLVVDVIIAIEKIRRGEKTEPVGVLLKQPVEEHVIQAFRRAERLDQSRRRILFEVETGGAERQIEDEDDGVALHFFRRAPGDVMGERRGAGPAPRADKGDGAADRRR